MRECVEGRLQSTFYATLTTNVLLDRRKPRCDTILFTQKSLLKVLAQLSPPQSECFVLVATINYAKTKRGMFSFEFASLP